MSRYGWHGWALRRRRAQSRQANFDADDGALEDSLISASSKGDLQRAYSLAASLAASGAWMCSDKSENFTRGKRTRLRDAHELCRSYCCRPKTWNVCQGREMS